MRVLTASCVSACLALAGLPGLARATWPPNGTPLCTETHLQTPAAIVPDGAGGAVMVWADSRFGTSEHLYAQRVDSSGVVVWSSDGIAVCTASGSQQSPLAIAGLGGTAFFWQDTRNGNYDVYGQFLDGAGIAQWTFNGIPLTTNSNDERAPQSVSDGRVGTFNPPGWVVAWLNYEDTHEQTIHVQHVTSDGAGLWTTAPAGGVALTTASGIDVRSMAMTGDGVGTLTNPKGAVVVWSQEPTSGSGPTDFDIYARRISGFGAPQWAANGVVVCDQPGPQLSPSIVNVGSGEVIVAWDDRRTLDQDIYAQKLNSSGAVQWLADGVPVCRASGNQTQPQLTRDGSGGAFVVWTDARSGTLKTYAQRLDGNGTPLWPVDGIPVCTAAGHQLDPAIVSDLTGGFIVVWQDRRGPNDDLYAQRVDGNGNLLWASGGVPLTLAPDTQEFPSLISDGKSGAIVGWRDHRAGGVNTDVYANRVGAGGSIVDVPSASPRRLAIAFASSNPARGEVRMRLDLPAAAIVRADVIDAQGRRVRTLDAGSPREAGVHVLSWDGSNEAGRRVPPGLFFVRVRAGSETLTGRVVELD